MSAAANGPWQLCTAFVPHTHVPVAAPPQLGRPTAPLEAFSRPLT